MKFPSKIIVVGFMSALLTANAADPAYWAWAATPPMGWNSWDCFGAGVWETNVVANADYMAKNLKPHGWNLITIDIQWYEPLAHSISGPSPANPNLNPNLNLFFSSGWRLGLRLRLGLRDGNRQSRPTAPAG